MASSGQGVWQKVQTSQFAIPGRGQTVMQISSGVNDRYQTVSELPGDLANSHVRQHD
jgi:hypothetical protein